jgi:hypothetical protein
MPKHICALALPNGSTMEHNIKTHQYEWTRGWGPSHCRKRREKKHHKWMEENENIRENPIKMHPNKGIRG